MEQVVEKDTALPRPNSGGCLGDAALPRPILHGRRQARGSRCPALKSVRTQKADQRHVLLCHAQAARAIRAGKLDVAEELLRELD